MTKVLGLLLAIAVGVLAVWIVWPRTEVGPGVLEANGRVEGDQAAVRAKVGGRVIRLRGLDFEVVSMLRLAVMMISTVSSAKAIEGR